MHHVPAFLNSICMKYIIYIAFGLTTCLTWGLLLLDANNPGIVGLVACMLYTFYSSYFLRLVFPENSRLICFIKLFFPLCYLIAYVTTEKLALHFLLSPMMVAFVYLLLGHRLKSLRAQTAYQFFVLFSIFIYSFTVHNYWLLFREKSDFVAYNFRDGRYIKDRVHEDSLFSFSIPTDFNIDRLVFESSGNDKFKIQSNGKPIILESWNERCIPCLKAIDDLQYYFDENSELITHFYVYEPDSDFYYEKDNIFSFAKIGSKGRILIDSENEMYSKLNLKGYPYFIFFDSKGVLTNIQFGYHKDISNEFKEKIMKLVTGL